MEEDILDFLDENINTGKLTVGDIDSNINKIESMRTQFRRIHQLLKKKKPGYEDKYLETCNSFIQKMKDYILDLKDCKSKMRDD